MANVDGSDKILLQKHHSAAVEVLSVSTALVLFLFAAFISYAAKATLTACLLVPTILGIFSIAIATPFMGGLRYEFGDNKLVIKSGLLRIRLKKITINSILYMEPSSYNVFRSTACGWCNKFPDGTEGYVRGFRGKALIISTADKKYLLASEDPKELKAKIEKISKQSNR